MSKKYPCVEYTVDIELIIGDLRVWIDNNGVLPESGKASDELNSVIKEIEGIVSVKQSSIKDLCTKIAAIPLVNAVQFREKSENGIRNGIVIYTKKFDEDPHG